MYRLRSYAIVLAVALAAAGCGSSGGAGGVSLDQEWQLGNQLAAQVQQQVRLVNDPVAISYVRSVGERIHSVTPLLLRMLLRPTGVAEEYDRAELIVDGPMGDERRRDARAATTVVTPEP